MSDKELRQTILLLAHNQLETPENVVARAGLYLDFIHDCVDVEPEVIEAVEPEKPARRTRKAKDENPPSSGSTTSSSASADASSPEEQPTEGAPVAEPEPSGDDLVEAPQPDVSEVNAAVLAACKPDGIGKTRVIELLGEFGSPRGVPGLAKDKYRAFLDALEAAANG